MYWVSPASRQVSRPSSRRSSRSSRNSVVRISWLLPVVSSPRRTTTSYLGLLPRTINSVFPLQSRCRRHLRPRHPGCLLRQSGNATPDARVKFSVLRLKFGNFSRKMTCGLAYVIFFSYFCTQNGAKSKKICSVLSDSTGLYGLREQTTG